MMKKPGFLTARRRLILFVGLAAALPSVIGAAPLGHDQIGWIAVNKDCCQTGPATLKVTIDGITRTSVLPACGAMPSKEGMAIATLDTKSRKSVEREWVCGVFPNQTSTKGSMSIPFVPGMCYEISKQGVPAAVSCTP